jgi:hypothetical protein
MAKTDIINPSHVERVSRKNPDQVEVRFSDDAKELLKTISSKLGNKDLSWKGEALQNLIEGENMQPSRVMADLMTVADLVMQEKKGLTELQELHANLRTGQGATVELVSQARGA